MNEHYGNVPAYEDLLKHAGHDARVGYMVVRAPPALSLRRRSLCALAVRPFFLCLPLATRCK